jgi:Acyl-CoA reductase (LuxC)
MNLSERIKAFDLLGDKIDHLSEEEREKIIERARSLNSWFVPESINLSLKGISLFLKEENLLTWASRYDLNDEKNRKVGLAMAGNIPLVGFHDYLCVLISGNQAVIKLSSQDSYLLPTINSWLIEIEPRFADRVHFEERLNNVDAIIATGSDNTARYFEYYFRKIPHIIRKNRSSVAILMGEEETQHLTELGKDVFSYFGLGCRNISKVFVPEGYEFIKLLDSWDCYKEIINHHKYANNYDYQKSILLVNKVPHLDNGFILLTQNELLVSPISVLYFETYTTQSDLKKKINSQREKIQCIVSANGWFEETIPFGQAQVPALWDYADGIDTLKFLTEIK